MMTSSLFEGQLPLTTVHLKIFSPVLRLYNAVPGSFGSLISALPETKFQLPAEVEGRFASSLIVCSSVFLSGPARAAGDTESRLIKTSFHTAGQVPFLT